MLGELLEGDRGGSCAESGPEDGLEVNGGIGLSGVISEVEGISLNGDPGCIVCLGVPTGDLSSTARKRFISCSECVFHHAIILRET